MALFTAVVPNPAGGGVRNPQLGMRRAVVINSKRSLVAGAPNGWQKKKSAVQSVFFNRPLATHAKTAKNRKEPQGLVFLALQANQNMLFFAFLARSP
jgi:hypothetical protein